MRVVLFPAALALAAPAAAQDGVYDATIRGATDDQVTIGLNRIHAHRLRQSVRRRDAARGVTAAQASACASKGRFRARHGADDPKVRRLYDLCRRAGL
ncbi:hypothetical protein [Sphingomonas lenta]|uniref:UrcA family protein n=1 Tax=Sphingomonas lenta TaxID=1141887 RepID=A0A2A2SCP5_9SPHN|nr:hypothetical protein [Sphingomonas lenta]PAX06975.1 hypothetical protein CKY28_12975 [Sphingomonas lenta]